MQQSIHGAGWRWGRRGAVLASLGVFVLSIAATAALAQPRAIAANEVRGCCVCRGTAGGDSTVVRSCSDGLSVEACTSQCKGEDADSLAFGYQQTCSQGCAGFPTQSAK